MEQTRTHGAFEVRRVHKVGLPRLVALDELVPVSARPEPGCPARSVRLFHPGLLFLTSMVACLHGRCSGSFPYHQKYGSFL